MAATFAKCADVEVLKVDEALGLVFGWAIVCKVDGEDYFDLGELQKDGSRIRDHIPESVMLKASFGFMKSARVMGDMHERDENGLPVVKGDVLYCMPWTEEIAKAFGMSKPKKTGLMVAAAPHDAATLKKFAKGEYTGFSIGGWRLKDRIVE